MNENCLGTNTINRTNGGENDVVCDKIFCATSVQSADNNCNDKKKRRRKQKRNGPYRVNVGEMIKRNKFNKRRLRISKGMPTHAAPYNSNRFLIEDHNDLGDLDEQLLARSNSIVRPRVRQTSFTSVDSDDDNFYSSPEDEEEFLTKEFSNDYKALRTETLNTMSKFELVQYALQLEERIELLEKSVSETNAKFVELNKSPGQVANCSNPKHFQDEISKLALANEELKMKNAQLLEKVASDRSSGSSIDNESDSSSSNSSDEGEDQQENKINQQSSTDINKETQLFKVN